MFHFSNIGSGKIPEFAGRSSLISICPKCVEEWCGITLEGDSSQHDRQYQLKYTIQ